MALNIPSNCLEVLKKPVCTDSSVMGKTVRRDFYSRGQAAVLDLFYIIVYNDSINNYCKKEYGMKGKEGQI